MSEQPTLWSCDLNRADGSAAKARAGDLMVKLQSMGILVPVEPDYEAAREAVFGLAVLPSDVEAIVNAALGLDDEEIGDE